MLSDFRMDTGGDKNWVFFLEIGVRIVNIALCRFLHIEAISRQKEA